MLASEIERGFVIGLFATVSPCVLPLYPGFLAYLASSAGRERAAATRWLGLVVLAGVLTMMLALGAVMSLLALSAGSVLRIVTPLADLVVILLGIALVLGLDPFARLPAISSPAAGGGPLRSAYVYGLLYGPIALPCSAPLLIALFGVGLSLESAIEVFAFFLAFGLGFGSPLVALSLLAYSAQRTVVGFLVRHHALISRGAGVLLIAVGLADLANNVPLLFP